jgi:hypothetical protein
MALKIKFMGGAEQAYTTALETEEYFGGSNRRTLTFEIPREKANLETLDALCGEENLGKLELINEEEGITNIYDGYTMKLRLGIEQKLLDPETNAYGEHICLKLGKLTYIESRLKALGAI